MNNQEMAKKMMQYAQSLPASAERAQAYHISELLEKLNENETIASVLINDHRSIEGCYRAARLIVEAGLAEEINKDQHYFGTFLFADGSTF